MVAAGFSATEALAISGTPGQTVIGGTGMSGALIRITGGGAYSMSA